jgi:protein O-GlcNAc transferase
MHLMARLFELHDRREFEVHLFSYGPPVHDAMRRRVSAAADLFHDVHALSDAEVALQARMLGLDIAVDLSGYTRHSRLGIFAERAAPTQVSYLGYPGTTGAAFIDYLLADRVIVPEADHRYYTERIIYLPHCYQINDNTRVISERPMSRAEMGLPEQAIVLCCFNNSFKIGREEFEIWMRMLSKAPGSVLWLLRADETAEQNLRRSAARCGVDPARLIFADRMPLSEHLARHRLADLFVDSFHYNAHTTASDALWAGLPLVTRIGRGFAARVAASLLEAVGLPELVTDSSQGYEQLVWELISDAGRLADVRAKLAVNRDRSPLFDTQASTRALEADFYASASVCCNLAGGLARSRSARSTSRRSRSPSSARSASTARVSSGRLVIRPSTPRLIR